MISPAVMPPPDVIQILAAAAEMDATLLSHVLLRQATEYPGAEMVVHFLGKEWDFSFETIGVGDERGFSIPAKNFTEFRKVESELLPKQWLRDVENAIAAGKTVSIVHAHKAHRIVSLTLVWEDFQ